MKIEWIRHHNPDLEIINENGVTQKKVDLSKYNYQGLHKLFAANFRKKTESSGGRLLSMAPPPGSKGSRLEPQSASISLARNNEAIMPQPSDGQQVADSSSARTWGGTTPSLELPVLLAPVVGIMLIMIFWQICVWRQRAARQHKATAGSSSDGASISHVA